MTRALVWRLAAAVAPAGFGVLGVINGLADWRESATLAQQLSSAGVILYGPLGLGAAALLVAGHRLARPALIAWALTVTAVAGIAPVAWGSASAMIGVLSAFSCAMLMAAVLWAAMEGTPARPPGEGK